MLLQGEGDVSLDFNTVTTGGTHTFTHIDTQASTTCKHRKQMVKKKLLSCLTCTVMHHQIWTLIKQQLVGYTCTQTHITWRLSSVPKTKLVYKLPDRQKIALSERVWELSRTLQDRTANKEEEERKGGLKGEVICTFGLQKPWRSSCYH